MAIGDAYSASLNHDLNQAPLHVPLTSTVRHNFAYKVQGHTFFVEDGNERFNLFEENLGAGVQECVHVHMSVCMFM